MRFTSYLASGNFRIEKTTVITCWGKRYTTPRGFASMLAGVISGGMMMNFHRKETNVKKYGLPYLAKTHARALKKYNENESRLYAKAYRRILPIAQRLFDEVT